MTSAIPLVLDLQLLDFAGFLCLVRSIVIQNIRNIHFLYF